MRDRSPPRKIYGVDFSGAADAGKRIWIANGMLLIDACFCEGGLSEGGSVGTHPFGNMYWTTTFVDFATDSADGTHHYNSAVAKGRQPAPIILGVPGPPQKCRKDDS